MSSGAGDLVTPPKHDRFTWQNNMMLTHRIHDFLAKRLASRGERLTKVHRIVGQTTLVASIHTVKGTSEYLSWLFATNLSSPGAIWAGSPAKKKSQQWQVKLWALLCCHRHWKKIKNPMPGICRDVSAEEKACHGKIWYGIICHVITRSHFLNETKRG